jgi:hypothetical protein
MNLSKPRQRSFCIKHLQILCDENAIKCVKIFNETEEKQSIAFLSDLHKLEVCPMHTCIQRIIHGQYDGKLEIGRSRWFVGTIEQCMFPAKKLQKVNICLEKAFELN